MLLSLFLSAGLMMTGPAVEHSVDSIDAVVFTSDKGITISHRDTISSKNALSLSEVISQSTSLQMRDNGGMGGLKTVSLRGMGSAHTSIYIDGVRVGNVQSGQNDLTMFDVSGSSIVIDYTQNSLNILTERPTFDINPVRGKAGLTAGSFGTWLPFMQMDFRLSDHISLSANASGGFSKGDFNYGEGLKRTNNDFSQVRAGADLFGTTHKADYHIKAFFNESKRGSPGSLDWPSEDRQEDLNAFVQGSLKMSLSSLYTLNLSAKGGYDQIAYTSTWGDSRYEQTDVQLNTVHDFHICDWCRLSAAADLHWTGLESTSYGNSRLSSLAALGSALQFDKFSAYLAIEYCMALDEGGMFRDVLSPSANIKYRITEGLEFYALGRRMYRIPVFNELYYAGYGNPELKSEDAWTAGLGLDFTRSINRCWKIQTGIDGFYTLLTDKITSAPSPEDPNIWMPLNIGKVRSAGFDSDAEIQFSKGHWSSGIRAAYSFLSSIDRTPDSQSFGQQVPYTARHNFSVSGELDWKGWELHTCWRLCRDYLDSTGGLPDWNTLDLSLSKQVKIKKAGTLIFRCSCKNISDFRYEYSSGYPMPGRSIMGGIEFKF